MSMSNVWCGGWIDDIPISRIYQCGHDCSKALSEVMDRVPHVNPQDKTGIVKANNGMLLGMQHREVNFTDVEPIMPAIICVDVKYGKELDEYGNTFKVPKAVFVTFADNTVEKAKLSADDTFSVEQGISICVTKKLIAQITGFSKSGGSLYNKIVKQGLKVYKECQEAEQLREKTAAEREARLAKIAEKKKARDQRRLEKKREDEIAIQSEAMYRAMRKLKDESNVANPWESGSSDFNYS